MLKINWNVLLGWLLPSLLRFAMLIEYMQVAYSQLNNIYMQFKLYVNVVSIDMNYQCSIADLEYRLHQTFYNTEIIVLNNDLPGDSYVFSDIDEQQTMYIFEDDDYITNPLLPLPYIFSDSLTTSLTDFTVYVPIIVSASDLAISTLIELYKPVGKTFNVQRI